MKIRIKCEYVSLNRVCVADGARGKLYNRVGPEAAGKAPGANIGTNFQDLMLAIEIDEIDGKAHSEGVHGLARYDPEPFACRQSIAAKETLAAGGAIAS